MRVQRTGITLVETLIVLSIIALLVAILIPAVHHARETARRTTCQNNLRQVALAIQGHESTQGSLPSLYRGTFLKQPRYPRDEFHFHSWRTAILPQLEQAALYHRIDLSRPATDTTNQTNLNTALATFVCPSANTSTAVVPDIFAINDGKLPTQVVGTAARSDYEVMGGVVIRPYGTLDLQNVRFGAWGEPLSYRPIGTPISYRLACLSDISDGLSTTILLGERAGRPNLYRRGKPVDPYPYTPGHGTDHHQAAWGISTHFWWLVFWHEQSINETNSTGIYSFHAPGAHVALADGSVRFLLETMDQGTLNALVTRSEGDVTMPE